MTAPLGRSLFRAYAGALREEPKLRAYVVASVVDDIGIAISTWASQLLITNLFTDQRERARLLLPTLVCFLAGCLVAGPLADWGARTFPEGLSRWRWRLVVHARIVETLALGLAIWAVAGNAPTIARVMPYFMISGFMKTALRPTRIAFEVDLLHREEAQLDANGAPVLDERGAPRMYKVHLLSFDALTSFLRAAALLVGLFLGGEILAAVGGRYAPLLVADVATNVCFIAIVFLACHPDRGASAMRLRDLWRAREGERSPAPPSTFTSAVRSAIRELGASLRDAWRFLVHADQRPLLWLMSGGLMVEIVNEFYDGKMIVKHVLHAGDDTVRHAEIVWSIAAMAIAALVPALARRVDSLGKIFLVTMLLDGAAIAIAGRLSGVPGAAAMPFVACLAADRGLTGASMSLVSLAQNSASSAAMRGRLAAAFALAAIVSDMIAEGAATALSEAIGIPSMLGWIGVAQMILMAVVALAGGKRLWRFGLRSTKAPESQTSSAFGLERSRLLAE